MQIITRAQWGARAPRSRSTVAWSQRTGVAIHHSAGPTSQTPRQIQDFHMDGRGWADVGYNFLFDQSGRVYEGRGWTAVGAHAANQNTGWVGVCWIGDATKVTPSPAALAAARWVVDEARRRAGRTLQVRGHGQLPGQATECPGGPWRSWIAAGMPAAPSSPPPAERSWLDMATEADLRRIIREELGGPAVFGRRNPTTDRSYAQLTRGQIPIKSLVTGDTVHATTVWARSQLNATEARDMLALQVLPLLEAIASGQAGPGLAEQIAQSAGDLAARLDRLEEQATAAAEERAEIAALVRQVASGELEATAVVDEIGRRLGAAASDGGEDGA